MAIAALLAITLDPAMRILFTRMDPFTVKGCAGTVVISAFGVKKTIKKEDATIEFIPDKTGTIEIACGMNMVKGALVATAQ